MNPRATGGGVPGGTPGEPLDDPRTIALTALTNLRNAGLVTNRDTLNKAYRELTERDT